jgi:hypothetical protein
MKGFFPCQRADHTPSAEVYGYLAFSATLFIPGLPCIVTSLESMLFQVISLGNNPWLPEGKREKKGVRP